MQLLIILALLLYGGRSDAGNILNEVKPVLETIGGEQMKEALKSAKEISEVLSAVQGIAEAVTPEKGFVNSSPSANTDFGTEKSPAIAFPLSPVSAIADKDITYSLSKYISQT